MLYRSLTALACVVFICSGAIAQRDFRPGYIVKGGDTLKGLVQYGRMRSANEVRFKSRRLDKATVYTTTEVSAYGFAGNKQYVALDLGTRGGPGKVFVVLLQKGEIDLYFRKGKYILIKEGKMTVLDRKPDSMAVVKDGFGENKGTAIVKDLRFLEQLNALLASDCGLNANNVKFARDEITRVISEHNKCRNNYVPVETARPIMFGASASFGIYNSTLVLDSIAEYKFKADKASIFQFDVEVRLPNINDRFALSLGLQPVKSTYRTSTYVTSTTTYRQDDMILAVKYLKIPFSIKYNFGNPANSSFIKLGGWVGKLSNDLKFNTVRTTRDLWTNATVMSEQRVPNGYRNPGGGFFGVGYDMRVVTRLRVFGELRYERNLGFIGTSAGPYSGFDFISVHLGVGF